MVRKSRTQKDATSSLASAWEDAVGCSANGKCESSIHAVTEASDVGSSGTGTTVALM